MRENENKRPPRRRRARRPTPAAPPTAPAAATTEHSPRRSLLKVIPLGGVDEVGKNCTLFAYGEDLILVDAGAAFPGIDEPGVDLLVPDVAYLRTHAERLRAIVLTHGHEDHIGGLAFVAQQIGARRPIPVYGSALALGLARGRLQERKALRLVDLRPITAGQRLTLGALTIEFVPVGHSIPDAMSLVIHTGIGPVLYTGDWKFSDMPPQGRQRLEALGREGVTAVLADCVRIETPGHTPSEASVARAIEGLLRAAPARVIVTTFASNIRRVADTIAAAHSLGRACVLVGRSMERALTVAREVAGLQLPEGALITVEQARHWPREKVVLITTGSQGEPAAALARIAAGTHRQIRVHKGDTVIVAASPIPGNEESVARTIDSLFRQGANVHYARITPDIHVSGHAAYDDHVELLRLLRPRFVAPFHGEYRMMVLYQRMAAAVGLRQDQLLMPTLGGVLEFERTRARTHGTVPSGQILVDGLTVGAVTSVVLRDRRALADEGLLVVAIAVDRETGRLIGVPDVLARGLPGTEDGRLMDGVRARIRQAWERRRRGPVARQGEQELIKEAAGAYILRETGLRPMVLPVVTTV